ncbi:MAG: ABC transporter ATP-binding protein/permease [Deltaproteobacteria bacterium]|jgi:ATP-binding cassette subfamily B protein|nr:ABC transporter ATP-binding protein/permease [Deltaproteobacteria bacterium]
MKNLNLIAPYFRRSVFAIAVGFCCLSVCDLGQMYIPRLVGRIIDALSEAAPSKGLILKFIAIILGVALMVALLRYAWRTLIYGFSRKLEKDLRFRLHSHFVSLSLSWHNVNSSGDLMALATNDIESVRVAVGFGLVSLMDAIVLGVAAVLFMLSINVSLCFWAFLPLPLISVLTAIFGRRIFQRVLDAQNYFAELTEVTREHVSGFKVIRAMALEELARGEVRGRSLNYVKKNVHLSWVMGLFFPLLNLLTNLAIALTLFFGGRAVIAGEISPGDFVAFISYLGLLAWPLMAMGLTIGLLQQGLASLARLARVLSARESSPRPLSGGPARAASSPGGPLRVSLQNVDFIYPGRVIPALRDVTLELCPGAVTALTGPTGSGKSTLAALLPALYEPAAGSVRLNGVDSREYSLEAVRSFFGYVPQDGYVFSGTILENVRFGAPGATEEEALRVLALAALKMDRDVFPDGLHTRVGEKGLTLSGGQKQRLALARALLIDPPYLILDDTLSAVDAQVEEEILNNIARERAGRGALIISHRLTSLAKAQIFFVLEEGRLTAQGTFAELARQEGYFKRIAEIAFLGERGAEKRKSIFGAGEKA